MSADYLDTSTTTIRYIPPRVRMSFHRGAYSALDSKLRLEAYSNTFAYLRAAARHTADLKGQHDDLDPCGPILCMYRSEAQALSSLVSHRPRCTLIHGLGDVLPSSFSSHTPCPCLTNAPQSPREDTAPLSRHREEKIMKMKTRALPSFTTSSTEMGSGTRCRAGHRVQEPRARGRMSCMCVSRWR
ncbi:hypothetical protein B0H13DRAFT_72964 [Mycena leptocephala]|nr:hypothetical protein B0H13DRAFT_72964 [Mycena leptocephala]